jgi:hypothetical protein
VYLSMAPLADPAACCMRAITFRGKAFLLTLRAAVQALVLAPLEDKPGLPCGSSIP